ncbi:hypothetical protein CONPUDRAFT_72484 [Coniophora puteana RWD-64-598 SS2]|uniref:Uncharacterized protein n=1 Tax=Coniophora puteana (strain RWD-64-598) TaxID=741705 RepID=A0A5M3MSV9_CONPW|nr:uncharacterized protein CONPUDRAFT_72484 [Coniophora puteana RWD-64-598 SS2]EIW82180.1 hypothetical protein CONPUDRAFT_72484 [Coniophora puteana RWD-64-598 SS2]
MSLPFLPGLPITKESWDQQPYQQQVQWYAHLSMTVVDPALVDNDVRHQCEDSHCWNGDHPINRPSEPNPYAQQLWPRHPQCMGGQIGWWGDHQTTQERRDQDKSCTNKYDADAVNVCGKNVPELARSARIKLFSENFIKPAFCKQCGVMHSKRWLNDQSVQ